MPLIQVITNVELEEAKERELTQKVSKLASGLAGKPEQWVMAHVKSGASLTFGGSFDPAIYCEFKSVNMDMDTCKAVSQALCGFFNEELNVAPERVFIEFMSAKGTEWGWNGSTF